MNWTSFGAGVAVGAFGVGLIKKLFNAITGAFQGFFKFMMSETRQRFNEDVFKGSFSMERQMQDDFKAFSNPNEARRWLLLNLKKMRYNGILLQGRLFLFQYDEPLTKDQLEYYDTEPLVLSFGLYLAKTGNLVEYGINIHYLPIKIRQAFMTDIFELFRKQYKDEMYSDTPRPVNQFNWEVLRTFVDKYGIDFAVRSYIPERRKNAVLFEYADWGKACMIPSKGFIGTDDRAITRQYKQHLRNAKR